MSSARPRLAVLAKLWLGCMFAALSCQILWPQAAATQPHSAPVAPFGATADPAQIFLLGQEALKENRLAEAERDFRRVLAANPEVGGAYANLGVVYMRRKQWSKALEALNQAEHLMPQVAGIRLNIGLAYFRQNEFLKAIPLFE